MARRRPPPKPKPLPKPKPVSKPKPLSKPKPKPQPINPLLVKNNELIKINSELTKKNSDLTTQITGLNFNIRDISNQQKFYKDKMYGSGNETGYLNIITKNSKLENFSNIEGFDVAEKNLNDVIRENKLLESQIQQNTNNYTADDTQVFYKKQQYYRQKELNNVLYFVFYILVLFLISYLFIFNTTIGIYLKIFITIILVIYPFTIEYINFWVYFVTYYLYSFVSGVPFNMDSY